MSLGNGCCGILMIPGKECRGGLGDITRSRVARRLRNNREGSVMRERVESVELNSEGSQERVPWGVRGHEASPKPGTWGTTSPNLLNR